MEEVTSIVEDADIAADAADATGPVGVSPVPLLHVLAAVDEKGNIVGFGFEWSKVVEDQRDWQFGARIINELKGRLDDAGVIGDMLGKLARAAEPVAVEADAA
jgi:hypothetical protein